MPETTTFKVSKRGGPSVEVALQTPESVEDPRWEELVSNYPDDINNLAVRNLIVSCQAAARERLDPDAEEEENQQVVQAYVDSYVYGARTGGGPSAKPKIKADKAKELNFSDEQIAALKAAGVSFED